MGGASWAATTIVDGKTQFPATVLNSAHAVLFAAGDLKDKGSRIVEVSGIPGSLCGGEGAMDEAQSLRQELKEKLDEALASGADPVVAVMDEGLTSRAVEFLKSSASDFMAGNRSEPLLQILQLCLTRRRLTPQRS